MKLLAITPKDVKKKNSSLVYSGTVNKVFFSFFPLYVITAAKDVKVLERQKKRTKAVVL